jgi:hypothetical protein
MPSRRKSTTTRRKRRSAVAVVTKRSTGLDKLTTTFRSWLDLPDAGVLYVALATVIANRLDGDPVWTLLVGPSSSVKTEVLRSLRKVKEVKEASTLTGVQALLSGKTRNKDPRATGGLLHEIGDSGILVLRDFGGILTMRSYIRAPVLSALRDCHDGSWIRAIGEDGGKSLTWEGKLGFLGGATPDIDRHHSVINELGSRWNYYRTTIGDRYEQADAARKNSGHESEMRENLSDAVIELLDGIDLSSGDFVSDADGHRLNYLAVFASRARTAVARENYYSREIELIPDPDGPARLVKSLTKQFESLQRIGLTRAEAWKETRRVAFDSMPAQRLALIEHMNEVEVTTTQQAMKLLGLKEATTRRALEDLEALHIVQQKPGKAGGLVEQAKWQLTKAAKTEHRQIDWR